MVRGPDHGPGSDTSRACGGPSAHQPQSPSFPCRGDDGAAGECFHDYRTDMQKGLAQGRKGTATTSAVLWRLREGQSPGTCDKPPEARSHRGRAWVAERPKVSPQP